jgi:molybdopterin-containing oxidoreductase family iron-sulfur binding subunit
MGRHPRSGARWGLVIDLDLCTGCGTCTVACALENNVPVPPPEAGDSRGLSWIKLFRVDGGSTEAQAAVERPAEVVFIPLPCQHCDDHPPCVAVCPQNATDVDPLTGIVSQIPERCLGCRYCMAACPYHARSFNWWDPAWPAAMEQGLNPAVSPRQRGTVEKCTLCHGRRQAAAARAAAEGRDGPRPEDVVPACAEACPALAFRHGDLADETSEVGRLARSDRAFRMLESLGLKTKVVYLSSRPWVRELGRGIDGKGGRR